MNVANIDLPYIEKNPSRHGHVRYYLRMDGKRVARLPDDIRSEEFTTEYWRTRNAYEARHRAPRAATRAVLSPRVIPNTFRWLCLAYMASPEFRRLDETTRAKRRSIIESMWLEPINKGKPDRLFADMPLRFLDAANIEVLRDRKEETPFAADERLKVLRQVFDTKGLERKPITPNVAKMVQAFRRRTDGHATATPEDLRQFLAFHGPQSKAAFYLTLHMFTGFRVSDLATLGPQHRRGDQFKFRLFKNRNRAPVDIELFIHPTLAAVLDSQAPTGFNYLVTEFGKAFTVKGLGNRISDWFTQAGLPHLTSHSIRKGLATDLAHNGATNLMLDSVFEWSNPKTSAVYTKKAERARMSRQAIMRINWDGLGTAMEPEQGVAIAKPGH